jgi:alkanesulfonate monooxygenase SsuD/methylene tetrahydromethanopterin reductase-like flavin-dependent oxidoreductase (luciferase family)
MAAMPRLQFGLNLDTSVIPGRDPAADARRAEELGFDFVTSSDHPSGTSPTYETWTLLSWVAAATSRIAIGSRVLGVPYRPPAMVAKMAETLDRLSGGRLILGLGGGYSDEEFRAFGLRVPTAGEKVDGLADAIAIARGLWSEPRLTYEGRLYRTEEAPMEPKAERRIPIWLGTYGPRALALTGRVADGWIPSLGFLTPEEAAERRARLLAAAEAAGRSPDEITCAFNVTVEVDEHATPEPGRLTGPPEAVAERLAGFHALGFTAFSLVPRGRSWTEQAERLAAEVIPAVRQAV